MGVKSFVPSTDIIPPLFPIEKVDLALNPGCVYNDPVFHEMEIQVHQQPYFIICTENMTFYILNRFAMWGFTKEMKRSFWRTLLLSSLTFWCSAGVWVSTATLRCSSDERDSSHRWCWATTSNTSPTMPMQSLVNSKGESLIKLVWIYKYVLIINITFVYFSWKWFQKIHNAGRPFRYRKDTAPRGKLQD